MSRAGRPKIVWTDKQFKQFESLCAMQASVHEIESVLQIDHKTINRLCKEYYKLDYSQAYKKFSVTGRISLRRMQFKLAEKSAAMAIFLGKNILGQSDFPENGNNDEVVEKANGQIQALADLINKPVDDIEIDSLSDDSPPEEGAGDD